MFIFPHGLRLKYSAQKRFPVPVYFTFVFTDEKGAHIYAACLKFYEKMSNQEVSNFFKYSDEKVSSHYMKREAIMISTLLTMHLIVVIITIRRSYLSQKM